MSAHIPPYVAALLEDIASRGGLREGQSLEDALKEAHERALRRGEELAFGRSLEARLFRRALAFAVWKGIRDRERARREVGEFVVACEQVAGGAQ